MTSLSRLLVESLARFSVPLSSSLSPFSWILWGVSAVFLHHYPMRAIMGGWYFLVLPRNSGVMHSQQCPIWTLANSLTFSTESLNVPRTMNRTVYRGEMNDPRDESRNKERENGCLLEALSLGSGSSVRPHFSAPQSAPWPEKRIATVFGVWRARFSENFVMSCCHNHLRSIRCRG